MGLEFNGKIDGLKLFDSNGEKLKNLKSGDKDIDHDKIGKMLRNWDPVEKMNKENKNKNLDNNPLNPNGTLKDGWEINPETGEYRKKPDNFIYQKDDDKYSSGNSMRKGKLNTMEFQYGVDDYKPTYELKDGKLVETGKIKIDDKPTLY